MPLVTIKNCLNCGIAHEWVFSGATLKELRLIKQLTAMSATDFAKAGDDGDPEALAALLYVLHKRDRITVPFEDIDVDFSDFDMEATQEELDEIDKLEKAMQREAEAPVPKPRKNGQPAKAA